MYYASKRFLVQVERPEQEGEIHTIYGTLPVKPNDVLATDEFGVQFVMSEDYFKNNYVAVKKVEPKPRITQKSPFEEAYAQALMGFSLESNVESDEYINGTKELIKE